MMESMYKNFDKATWLDKDCLKYDKGIDSLIFNKYGCCGFSLEFIC